MKCMLFAIVFIFTPILAQAQTNLDIFNYTDTPTGTLQRATMIHLSGWAFACSTGQQPFAVSVSYLDQSRIPHPLLETVVSWRQARPDVKAVFLPWCGELGSYTGWMIDIRHDGMPTGAVIFRIEWRDLYGEKWDFVTLVLQ